MNDLTLFTEIKILTEDAERLERCSEELEMDPSEIIHRLLDWYEQFMECEREVNKDI